MTYRTASKASFWFFMCLAFFFILSACEQNNDVSPIELAPVALPLWLDKHVNMPPQQWLIKRSIATVTDEEAQVEQARELLIIAANKFNESPRMIANRIAQLEDMLLENSIHETAVNLLEWFTKLPDLQTPHNFSALCQYYYNLRILGKTEDEIIYAIMDGK